MAEWLKAIHDCDLLVTDSFHGMCFALIFRRQFVLIHKDFPNWRHRHESLLRALRLEMRYVRGLEDYRYWQSHPIDYSQVEPRLNELIARSEDYLKRCLADHRRNPTREWLESIEIGQWQQCREMEEKVAQAARRGCLLRRLCGFIRRLGHRTA